jgi:hypothetical protein
MRDKALLKTLPLYPEQRLQLCKRDLVQVRFQPVGVIKANELKCNGALFIEVQFYIKAAYLVEDGHHVDTPSVEKKYTFSMDHSSLHRRGKNTKLTYSHRL